MAEDWKSFKASRRVTKETWYFREWGLFAYSFKKSADTIYEKFKKERSDVYWFPALFLYRQWIELALKSLWNEIQSLDGSLGDVPRIHNLSEIWKRIRAWFDARGIIAPDDDHTPSAERVFSELDAIDPDSTAFRYPPTKLPHPDIINIRLDEFEKALDQVDSMFIGFFQLMDEYRDYLQITMQEMRGRASTDEM